MEEEKKPGWFSNLGSLYLDSFKYIGRNILSLFLVCLICFTFVQLATSGFLKAMFNLAETINGKGYLAVNNITEYLKSPFIILIGLIYIIILVNIMFFQIGVFVYVFEQSKNKKKIEIVSMLNFGFYAMKKLLKPKNWIVYLFVLVILPFADVIHFTYFKMSLVVPGFILDFIREKLYLAIPYYLLVTAVIIITFMSLFSFHYFLLEDISFLKAMKKSIKLFCKHLLTNVVLIAMIALTIMIATSIISAIIVALMGLFRGKMYDIYAFLAYLESFTYSITIFVVLPVMFSAIASAFHHSVSDEEISYDLSKMKVSKKKFAIRNSIVAGFILAFSITDICLNVDNYSVYNTTSSTPIVIAHRGSSVDAPENSMPAFELAIEQGVDMIELDIHQTKDNVIVVSHDASLKKIAGIDKNVYDLTYEELSKIDVGSWYSSEYAGLKIATLEEVLELCKGKVKLIIEIKPTGHENHLEEDLLNLIYKYDMKSEVIIHSLQTTPLTKIKELDSTIEVAYCMVLAYGDISKITWSDCYTVEESNVSAELVRRVHEAGKKIYVWTINDPNSFQYLIDMGVDGFIGDNPLLMQETIEESFYDSGFSKFLRLFSLQKLVM